MKKTTASARPSGIAQRIVCGIGMVVLLFLLAGSSHAATLSWSGGGSSDSWGDSGNWGGVGTPANGDTIIFGAILTSRYTSSNNVSGRVLNQIQFRGGGGGFIVYGQAISVTNNISATNTAGANTISNTLTVATADVTILVSNSASLKLAGQIAGTAGVTKTGLGTLIYQYASSNPYNGTTRVNAGTLQLNVGGTSAFGGALVIGNGTGAGSPTVQLLQPSEISESAAITINRDGTLDLNGFNETVGISLTVSSAIITTGIGTLTLQPNATLTVNNVTHVTSISGNLNVGTSGTFTIQGSGSLNIYALVSGAASIVKNDSVNLYFPGANTFTGSLTANGSGDLDIANNTALGATNGGTTINGSVRLIMEGSITVTNEFLTMNSTYPSGAIWFATPAGNASWRATNITLGADTTILVATNATLELSAPLTGPVDVTKQGPGTLTYSGATANTYSGATTVTDGTLLLAKTVSNGGVVGSALIIGDGIGAANSAVVRDSGTFQISSTPAITINDDGLLDLNNIGEAVGNSLTLNGGVIQTGTGLLTLGVNAAITNSGSSFIYGSLSVSSGTCTIAGTGYLYLYADVSGPANIVKNDSVALLLFGSNTFTGTMTANGSGYLYLADSLALGSTNGGTILNGTTYLYLLADYNITNESLTMNSTHSPAIYVASGSTNVWSSTNFTFLVDTTIQVGTNAALELKGSIRGAGGVTKYGPGRLVYSGASANTYDGFTTVNEGELDLAKDTSFVRAIPLGSLGLVIGDGTGTDVVRNYQNGQVWATAPVTLTNSGVWDLNNFYDAGEPLTLNGGQILTGTGFCAMMNTVRIGSDSWVYGNVRLDSPNVVFSNTAWSYFHMNAAVAGYSSTYGLTKAGDGNMGLTASNSYGGLTVVQSGGWLWVANPWALGATSGGTVVSNGASLILYPNIGITNEALTLNGAGVDFGWAALEVQFGISTWAGPITNNADSTLAAYYAGSELHINGPISGAGGLVLFNIGSGGGSVYFEGTAANTYAGRTAVVAGCNLVLNKSAFDGAIPGSLNINGTVRLLNGSQINNSGNVFINISGLLDFNGYFDRFNGLSGYGDIEFGTGGYALPGHAGASSTFDGVVSGDGYIWKVGSGVLTLNGNNTYLRQTFVQEGTLQVNGDQHQSSVSVSSGATLGGSGTVGTIMASGNIAPGDSPGILTCSNLILVGTNAGYLVEITGPNTGTDYDQLNVRGTSTLDKAVLYPTVNFTKPVALGQQFTIIKNDGSDTNVGIFPGYPEGANYSTAGYNLKISYVGGGGNDVVLTLTSLPGSVVGSTVIAGNGSHTIDPNECNHVYLTLTNTSGVAMTGINATLSTTTRDVVITQPYATYPNLAANGRGTNLAPFQISTLPTFVCGTDINLQLIVDSSVGSFIINCVLHSGAVASSPSRYDNNVATAIPDVGSIDSTNSVFSFGRPLEKVTVSLWLTHTLDSDLSLSLISPDGTTVPLTMNIGAGANFGTGSADASRTLFDDVAGTPITAGRPPFVGTYLPQGSLSNYFYNPSPNGDWRLRITDGFGGSLGTLRNWSLFLYGPACSTGGGACDYCLGPISGIVTNTDLIQTNRIYRSGEIASCGTAKTWPGYYEGLPGIARHYDIYAFTNNTGADACVTAVLTSPGDLQAGIYLNGFVPSNVASNYLADSGDSTISYIDYVNRPQSCSASIPPGATFYVTVNELNPGIGSTYTLQLSGLPCPPPTLNIQPVAPNQNRISWDTSAGGYLLEAVPYLAVTNWTGITNEPIVSGGDYTVTNSTGVPPNRFYRLHKP